ncbi:MAG: hypothetical protein KIT72_05740 [Polyangiaceae bacterium]|nr:hypothetical protein [Polyangiaceae bacterium]MCW5789902.1 hypothetical protein [Polyangiaceae bacterium]
MSLLRMKNWAPWWVGLALVVGCGSDDEEPKAAACGENQERQGGSCQCVAGFEEVDGSCVATDDPCGAHGHSHGDHCDCDPGYEEVGGTCVVATNPCGPHGDPHGDHCDCDEGYHEVGGTCVAITDQGWVVGQVEQIAGLANRAVLWRDGVISDLNDYLPAGSGWVLTSAVDVNSRGDIVGRGTLNGTSRPFALIRVQ